MVEPFCISIQEYWVHYDADVDVVVVDDVDVAAGSIHEPSVVVLPAVVVVEYSSVEVAEGFPVVVVAADTCDEDTDDVVVGA